MLRRSAPRWPRPEHRATTAYEEFFGYHGAKRNAHVMGVLGFAIFGSCWYLVYRTAFGERPAANGVAASNAPAVLERRDELARGLLAQRQARDALVHGARPPS